jgi:ribosomal protein S18 acetylase RimI-like enzyme
MVRQAVQDDAKQIAVIHVRGWQTAYADHIPDDYLSNLRVEDREKDWRSWLTRDHYHVLVSKEAGKVVGYLSYSLRNDPAELTGLYVDPDRKYQGIGSKLMRQFEAETENQERRLWVLSGNDPAIAFYKKFGYIETGETKDSKFGGVSVTEIRMEKLSDHNPP